MLHNWIRTIPDLSTLSLACCTLLVSHQASLPPLRASVVLLLPGAFPLADRRARFARLASPATPALAGLQRLRFSSSPFPARPSTLLSSFPSPFPRPPSSGPPKTARHHPATIDKARQQADGVVARCQVNWDRERSRPLSVTHLSTARLGSTGRVSLALHRLVQTRPTVFPRAWTDSASLPIDALDCPRPISIYISFPGNALLGLTPPSTFVSSRPIAFLTQLNLPSRLPRHLTLSRQENHPNNTRTLRHHELTRTGGTAGPQGQEGEGY